MDDEINPFKLVGHNIRYRNFKKKKKSFKNKCDKSRWRKCGRNKSLERWKPSLKFQVENTFLCPWFIKILTHFFFNYIS